MQAVEAGWWSPAGEGPHAILPVMRKISLTDSVPLMFQCACMSLFGLCAAVSLAQGSGPSDVTASSMPKDGKELILLAANSNGLSSPGLQPWHLQASFKLLDPQGKTTDEGTIEEYWAGHHKRRITYSGKNFTQTTYWTEAGMVQSGPSELPSFLMPELRAALVEPIPNAEFLKAQVFEVKERDLGSSKLLCLAANVAPPAKSDGFQKTQGPTYCLNTDKPVLRITTSGAGLRQAVRNKIVSFQGRYIPQDLQIVQQGRIVATLQVENLEAIKTQDDSVFAPTADAIALPPRVSVLSGVANGMIITKAYPQYPVAAKQSHVQGTVVFQASIGKDGKISDLKVMSGPIMLQQAALDAVKQWAYWPFFMDGEAVEVSTKINVVFNLGD